MAGIYIHVPFCKERCTYCDFYTVTDESRMDEFVEALCIEAESRKEEVKEPVQTIYFGGGTPSRLSTEHFSAIFDTLYRHYPIDPAAEITVEANPDDLSEEYLIRLAQQPINRLSIGIQSFNDEELKFLSRRHSAQQAIDAVKRSQQHGFSNLNIDLMYGLPKQSKEVWQHNLQQATELGVPHVSAYHLIYEEKTRMHALLLAGKITPADEETSAEMFTMLYDWMARHNFIHYETSAFGKEGFFSRHNSSYWKNREYVGLGPAAHSFDGDSRSWNIASIIKYNEGIKAGIPVRESELLSPTDKYNEFIITGLRTIWGVNLEELEARFGKTMYQHCLKAAEKYLQKNLLTMEENTLKVTREGLFISDGITTDLMWMK